jgi:hypothetical protein
MNGAGKRCEGGGEWTKEEEKLREDRCFENGSRYKNISGQEKKEKRKGKGKGKKRIVRDNVGSHERCPSRSDERIDLRMRVGTKCGIKS